MPLKKRSINSASQQNGIEIKRRSSANPSTSGAGRRRPAEIGGEDIDAKTISRIMVGEDVTQDMAKGMREFMAANRVPLDPAARRRLSNLGHLRFIEALSQAFPMPTRRLTLHGGTSLHLIWGSPRFSEDLDFLLDRKLQPMISEIIPEIESRMRQALQSKDPGLNLTLADKTRAGSNLLNFRATLS